MKLFKFCLISLIFVGFLSSCSKDEEQKRIEITRIIESRDCAELVNDLYLAADGDEESIARILNVTPSVVNRIRDKETKASPMLEKNIRDVSLYFQLNGKNYMKLRSELDPKWKFIDTIGHLPSVHPVLFWTILISLIACLAFALKIWFWSTWPVFLGTLLIYLVVIFLFWILSAIFAPRAMDDPYVDSINPVVEQIV